MEEILKRPETDDISIKELILKLREWYRYILSKWLVILIFAIVGAILGFTYASFKKPVYTATTTFVLEESEDGGGGGLSQYSGLASMVGISMGGGSGGGIFTGKNILELYKSRTMIEKALFTEVMYKGSKQLLVNRYIEINELRKKWAEKPELKDIKFEGVNSGTSLPKFTRLQDSVLKIIVNDINKSYLNVSKPDKDLSIIQADVKSTDEFFAKSFDNQIVKTVNDFYVQTKTKKSLQNVIILQQKTDSVRAVMNGAIYSVAAIADATPNLNVTRQAQRQAPVQRSQAIMETNKAILSQLLQNLEISRMAMQKDAPLIQVVDVPIYPLDRQNFGRIKGVIFGLLIGSIVTILVLVIRRLFKIIFV